MPADKSSTAFNVGPGASVGEIRVDGDVVGGDKIQITEDTTYDVSGLPDPYLGLASYTYETRAFYGGREEEVRQALTRLTEPGSEQVVLFVTGDSGCGKSSFVQAGLLPALEQAYVKRGRRVRWSVRRPGRHPLAALAAGLEELGLVGPGAVVSAPEDVEHLLVSQTPPDQVNVLVLDQFEELITQSQPAERDAVFALVAAAAGQRLDRARTHLLVTLRSDYLPAIFQVQSLFEQLKRSGIELRAMRSADLERAIRRPLEEQNRRSRAEKRLHADLERRLINDVGTDSKLLPLLQVTLAWLWDEPPHRLTADRYRSLTDALQDKAERVYERDALGRERSEAERAMLMGILLDLVEVSLDDRAQRDVRRTLPRRELLAGQPDREPLLNELVDARLLATSTQERRNEVVEVVDIIHETLLRNWPRLRTAIADQRTALQSRERFRMAVAEWEAHGRSPDYLLEGVKLDAARELERRNDVALQDAAAREFLERSVRQAQQELAQARAQAQRLRTRLLAALGALAVALGMFGLAVVGFVRADQQARVNASRQLAAEAEARLPFGPELSILLAQEGLRRTWTEQADASLRRALVHASLRLVLTQPDVSLGPVAFSPDSARLLAGANDGVPRIWSLQTGAAAVELTPHRRPLSAVRFSHQGGLVLTAGLDGVTRLSSAEGGQPVRELDQGEAEVLDAAFSPDDSMVATAGSDGALRLWTTASGDLQATRQVGGGRMTGVRFSRAGGRLAAASLDQTTRVWQLDTTDPPRVVGGFVSPDSATPFDPDGRRLVTITTGGTAQVWDLASGAAITTLGGSASPVRAASFSPAGSSLLTTHADGTARLWDPETGRELAELRGHGDRILSARFSDDGQQVLTASQDHTARLWDARTGRPDQELRGHAREVTSAQLSPDARLVATTSLDGSVRAWSAEAGRDFLTLTSGQTDSIAFAMDGRLVAGTADGGVRVWAPGAATPAAATQPVLQRSLPSAVMCVRFSRDGRRLAVGLDDGRVWLLRTDGPPASSPTLGPGEIELKERIGALSLASFSPDGKRLLTSSADGRARVWDADSGDLLALLPEATGPVTSAVFDPDGQRIATASSTGQVRVWDAQDLHLVGDLKGYSGKVGRVAFSADGQRLIGAGADGLARVWDTRTGGELASLGEHAAAVYGVAFSHDGRLVLTTSADGAARVWDTRGWRRLSTLNANGAPVFDGTFSPDDQRVVTASRDGARAFLRELFAPLDEEVLPLIPRRVVGRPPELTAAERAAHVPD